MKKILWILPLLVLVGCGIVTNEEIVKAQKFCTSHDGLAELEHIGINIIVKCADGSKIHLAHIKK